MKTHNLYWKKRIEWLFLFTPLVCSCINKPQTTEKKTRPNILFILSDDHTSQAWGIYDGILAPYVKNKNIERLAKEGCVLDNCFCTNSISVPSRASILTGAYSHKNGVYTLGSSLNPEYDHIAKQLNKEGYQTALYGKWHLKSQPIGFDDFAVFHDQGRYWNPILKTKKNWVPHRDQGDTIKGFSTDIVTNMTINWIKNRNKNKPFLACCHFKATHEPWDFPKRNKNLYKDVTFPIPNNMLIFDWKKTGRTFEGQSLENLAKRWETASKTGKWWCQYPELPFERKAYSKETDRKETYQKLIRDFLRCGATIDQNIGRLLDYLESEGLNQNTIVIYCADQGYFLGEHGMFDKRMMYEEPLHMPFVIRYPKEIPANTRNKDLILNIDFAATLADYAETKAPNLSQGKSFRKNLKGETPKNWRKEIYYRYWVHEKKRPAHFGIRNKRYKLIYLYGQPLDLNGKKNKPTQATWEFYDLQKDPEENKNAYKDENYKVIIKKMKKQLLKLKEKQGDTDQDYPIIQELIRKWK